DQVTKNLTDTKSVFNSVINSQVMNCFSPHPTPYTLHPTPHQQFTFSSVTRVIPVHSPFSL
ncbi:MAG: hypothetical protein EWV64_11820, partial [Microcystis flos-aquae Ma_QC_C_20070823_S18]